ncbi:hypothetical protein, partial [Enterococcus casseliflavus]|uniref:hypothetical protein n=1 Tax=Enterococcus casseliflavus TaxID=37734 RepID=UPI003D0F3C59
DCARSGGGGMLGGIGLFERFAAALAGAAGDAAGEGSSGVGGAIQHRVGDGAGRSRSGVRSYHPLRQ